MEESRPQTTLIEQQKKISLTAVESVDEFSPRQIVLTLQSGRAYIAGEGLKIVGFSKSDGSFSAVGKIAGIRYAAGREKLVRKLFAK